MTDTVPAADPGLPSVDEHPDAKLLDLRALLVASEARAAHYSDRLAELSDRYEPPSIPAALIFLSSDRPALCSDPGRLAQSWTDGGWRPFYEDLDGLTPRARRCLDAGDEYVDDLLSTASRARVREIRTAFASWRAAIREAEQAAGVLEPAEALDREDEIIAGLRKQIGATPARTLEGLAAKARTLLGRRQVSAGPPIAEEPDLLSILLDVERLGAGDQSTGKRSAA